MLKLSTKSRYALRAMLELALREGRGAVQVREISKAQHISAKYLEQLLIPLHHAGLVLTERGPGGGYRLSRPAAAITALEVVEAVQGPLHLLECLARPHACDRSGTCAAQGLWAEVEAAISETLGRRTLDELRAQQRAALAGQTISYEI